LKPDQQNKALVWLQKLLEHIQHQCSTYVHDCASYFYSFLTFLPFSSSSVTVVNLARSDKEQQHKNQWDSNTARMILQEQNWMHGRQQVCNQRQQILQAA